VALGEYRFLENQLQMKEHSYIPADMWYSLPNICIVVSSLLQDLKIGFLSTKAEELIERGNRRLPLAAGFVLLCLFLLND
jgi:hypothetical protein